MLQIGTTCGNGIKYNKIWFVKIIGFLTMKRKFMIRPKSVICLLHKKANCNSFTITDLEQFVYVQYYDVLGDNDVPTDSVDNMLDCVRLTPERQR